MTPQVYFEYEDACLRLTLDIPKQLVGVEMLQGAASVPIYPDYNQRDPRLATYEIDVRMPVLTNVTKTGTLAIVPVALFEHGDILASAAFAGSLAEQLKTEVSEVLALRDGRWVCLGTRPGPTRRFPTLAFTDSVRKVLSGTS